MIVRRDGELSRTHPVLKQPRVDIHQRRAPCAREQSRVDRVVEVQQQVRPSHHGLSLRPCAAYEAEGGGASFLIRVERVEQRLPLEPEALHPLEEARKYICFARWIRRWLEVLEPIDLASEAAQRLDVLHVHPEVAAALREVGDPVDGDHHGDHLAAFPTPGVPFPRSPTPWASIPWSLMPGAATLASACPWSLAAVAVASDDISRKPMRRIPFSRIAWRTWVSHSVRSSSSRSAA